MKQKRITEAQAAATKIGAKSITFLNFKDGELGNKHIAYMEKKLSKEVTKYNADSIITFEPMGFSGHLDHIAVTTAAIQTYNRLPQVRMLHLFGITHEQRRLLAPYFVPIPPGYSKNSYGLIVDVSSVWNLKKESIAQYSSQSGDRDFWEPMLEGYHKHEHFIVQTKDTFSGWAGLVDQTVKTD
jgi:LmbE family N-acetylglucosaminyl deacetylase